MDVHQCVLDLLGGRAARPAANLLLGLGVASALPTAVTGLAEFHDTARREQRVAAVHAASNSTALAAYTASLVARRTGRQSTGVVLALIGGIAATAGGYLGGHLTEVRKVASYHPSFDDPPPRPPEEAWSASGPTGV